ncbi:hypothetical protein FZO89_08385 [Luteimonas viscosa]|uniref:Uncharacterized protein n=1 Tax=Luteimonas viscosa TaxID=1132694 RepID=A0A5D4XNP3_9GAMM|nr:hypothetical protein [Luteimonas viscosa]TYT26276.1 hypothetical protein FZO89_08385 [Luteimonas viscosa]
MNEDHSAAAAVRPDAGNVAGVLALELAPGSAPAVDALPQAQAARVVALLGRDLAALVPGVRTLDLCLAAAHFDPAEALRPGWPLHRRLFELQQRAPGGDGAARLIAFGADAGGAIPQPLAADASLRGGSLRVLPFLLRGDAGVAQAVGEAFEARLLDSGMARADTALLLQDAFGARIEHARCLTVHDLAAMVALQYEHLGLDPLWPLIETALLSPEREAVLDAPPEPLARYVGGEVRIALFAPAAWRVRQRPGTDDHDRLRRLFAQFESRQRQFAAVLGAHGIDVTFVDAAADVDAATL